VLQLIDNEIGSGFKTLAAHCFRAASNNTLACLIRPESLFKTNFRGISKELQLFELDDFYDGINPRPAMRSKLASGMTKGFRLRRIEHQA